MPHSSRHFAWTDRDALMFTPTRSSVSALPRPVRERLPCFATFAPFAAATNAASVLTLKLFGAPPVPAVSSNCAGSNRVGTRSTFDRITRTAPTSSFTDGTRAASSARNAPISPSCDAPVASSVNACSACASLNAPPARSTWSAGVKSPGRADF